MNRITLNLGPGAPTISEVYFYQQKTSNPNLVFFVDVFNGVTSLGCFFSWKNGPIPRSFWTEGPITGEGGEMDEGMPGMWYVGKCLKITYKCYSKCH